MHPHARILQRDSPVGLNEQLAEDMRRRISAGEFAGRLPSIIDLADDYEVSRDTAQSAMRMLAEDGTVIKSRGRGYWVAKLN